MTAARRRIINFGRDKKSPIGRRKRTILTWNQNVICCRYFVHHAALGFIIFIPLLQHPIRFPHGVLVHDQRELLVTMRALARRSNLDFLTLILAGYVRDATAEDSSYFDLRVFEFHSFSLQFRQGRFDV